MGLFKISTKKVEKWRHERNSDGLLQALDEEDFAVKAAAIEALGHIQYQQAAPLIGNLIGHKLSSQIRLESVRALARMHNKTTVGRMINALTDEKPEIQQEVKKALIGWGDDVIEPLIGNLNNFYNEDLRLACKGLLQEIGPRAVESLIEGLTKGTYGIREESANILGSIGNPKANDALIKALADKRIEVRKAAANALKDNNWNPSMDLFGAHFFVALGNFQKAMEIGRAAIPALTTWLTDEDVKIRRNIAIALHKLGWQPASTREAVLFYAAAGKFSEMLKYKEDAIDVLVTLLGDRDIDVKKKAAKVLKRIGVPRSVKSLVRDIEQIVEITYFRLPSGTFNLEKIGLEAQYHRGKFYLLKVENCDDEQRKHVLELYPEAKIIEESEAY